MKLRATDSIVHVGRLIEAGEEFDAEGDTLAVLLASGMVTKVGAPAAVATAPTPSPAPAPPTHTEPKKKSSGRL